MRRHDELRILVSCEEKAKIIELANKEKLTMSALVRKTMLDMCERKLNE